MRDNIIDISLLDMQLPELLYQNDSGQRIKIKEDVPSGTIVSFTNKKVQDSALPVEIINQEAEIPNVLLTKPGTLIIEIKVVEENSTTTVYRLTGKIKESAEMGTIPPENQPTFIEQITEIANDAKSVANDVKQRADSGEFNGEPGEPGAPGEPGEPGDDGKSAYQIAVEHGFIGTEEEWLASLKGEQGEPGTTVYSELSDKPSINSVELSGNKTAAQLNLASSQDLATVERIAKGATQSIAYYDYATLVDRLLHLEKQALNVGQNILLRKLEVPDVWICANNESAFESYTFVSDAKFIEDLENATYMGLQIGYYRVSELETAKVDLTNYVEKEQSTGTVTTAPLVYTNEIDVTNYSSLVITSIDLEQGFNFQIYPIINNVEQPAITGVVGQKIDVLNYDAVKFLVVGIVGNTYHIKYTLENEVVHRREFKSAVDGKQNKIDSNHKISADSVDDTNSTNKFVTSAEKSTWNRKQDALTFDDTPTASSNNPVKSGGVKSYVDTNTSKNYDAVFDEDDVFSRDRDDYPGIKQNDLIFEWLASGYYHIYKVMNDSGTLLLDIVGERISVSQNLITTNTGNKLYAPDSIVVTSDGKMYICASVTDDGGTPATYTYTWSEIARDSRVYRAVWLNNNISTSASDYPGIQLNDIAIRVSGNKVRIWVQSNEPDSVVYWTELDYNDKHVYEETTTPPSSINSSSQLYYTAQKGDVWIATTTANNVTTIDVYLLTDIEQVQTTKNLTWAKLTNQADNKQDKTTITTDSSSTTVSLTIADNNEYRYTQELTALTLTMPSGDFIASVVFASGSTATSMTYDSGIKWSGDDVTSNAFVPQANKTYNIVLWYDGINVNGVVRGV